MTPVARARFDKEKDAFFITNKRDEFQSFTFPEDIPGQLPHCLVYNPKEGNKPWFTSMCILVILDIL